MIEEMDLWDGGTTSINDGRDTVIQIMRSGEGDEPQDLVALIVDPSLLNAFTALPELIKAVQSVADAFQDGSYTYHQMIALGNVKHVLERIDGES